MKTNQQLSQQLAGHWEVTIEAPGHDSRPEAIVYCQSAPLWKFVDLACQRLGFKLKVGKVVEAMARVKSIDLVHLRLWVKLKPEQVKTFPPIRPHVRF